MKSTNVTKSQRARLVRAVADQIDSICRNRFGGKWDSMPKQIPGLPVDWGMAAVQAGIQTTPAGAYRLFLTSASDDSVMDLVGH